MLVRRRGAVDVDVQVDEQERDGQRRDPRAARARDREGDERGDAQAGDRQQPLGHARVAERRQRVPERRVERRVRPEREQDRHDRAEAEHKREPSPRAPEQAQPERREHRRRPAEEDEALRVLPLRPPDEVAPVRRVLGDGVQRPPAREVRVVDGGRLHEQPDADGRRNRRRDTEEHPPVATPHERIRADERHGPEREMHLPRERDRRDRDRREREPPALDRVERKREQDRDRPKEVPGALGDAVGRDREREPAGERRSARKPELPQPQAGEPASGEVREQHEDVPPADMSQSGVERPEHDPEGPAREVDRRARLRPEAVRVAPGRAAVLDLVSRQPEVVERLEVVAGRGLAVAGRAAGHESRSSVLDGGPRRGDAAPEVERAGERYEACAAASSSSKSGTSSFA